VLLTTTRWPGKGAVMTAVAAKMRERNKDLTRISNRIAVTFVAKRAGFTHQSANVRYFGKGERLRRGRQTIYT
jgi:hypothetical protein